MADGEGVVVEEEGVEGAPHAFGGGVDVDLVGDRGVAFGHRVGQLSAHVVARSNIVDVGDVGNHDLGGYFSRRMSTHAIGQCQQVGAGVGRVFVISADQSYVRCGRVGQGICHLMIPSYCTCSVVRPTRMASPRVRVSSWSMRCSLRYVPLRDSRSSTNQSFPFWMNRA